MEQAIQDKKSRKTKASTTCKMPVIIQCITRTDSQADTNSNRPLMARHRPLTSPAILNQDIHRHNNPAILNLRTLQRDSLAILQRSNLAILQRSNLDILQRNNLDTHQPISLVIHRRIPVVT